MKKQVRKNKKTLGEKIVIGVLKLVVNLIKATLTVAGLLLLIWLMNRYIGSLQNNVKTIEDWVFMCLIPMLAYAYLVNHNTQKKSNKTKKQVRQTIVIKK